VAGYGGEHRIVITREASMDELLLRVEPDEGIHRTGGAAVNQFRTEVAHKLQTVLGIRTKVEIVAPGSIQRTDFKARRVIDDREVFRSMHAELQKNG
jgi:phenylacetate-CoA ligase